MKNRFRDEVYGREVLVYSGCPSTVAERAFVREYNHEIEHDDRALEAFVLYEQTNPITFILWFRESKPRAATIAHECLHICVKTLTHCGISLSNKSEEAFAYYLDYLVRQVSDRVAR